MLYILNIICIYKIFSNYFLWTGKLNGIALYFNTEWEIIKVNQRTFTRFGEKRQANVYKCTVRHWKELYLLSDILYTVI